VRAKPAPLLDPVDTGASRYLLLGCSPVLASP
jgi:hypothetical protein